MAQKSGRERRRMLRVWARMQGCQLCGLKSEENEFHHVYRDPRKTGTGSRYALGLMGAGALIDEICQCVILCPTCHELHHDAPTKTKFSRQFDEPMVRGMYESLHAEAGDFPIA